MADAKALAATLNDLLDECATTPADLLVGRTATPAAALTRKGTAISAELIAGSPLPKELEQFLAEYIAFPEHSAQFKLFLSSTMQEFGTRMFCRLLVAGLHRRKYETDLSQNKH